MSILNAALFGLLLSWLVTLAAHWRFRRTNTSAIGFILIVAAIAWRVWGRSKE